MLHEEVARMDNKFMFSYFATTCRRVVRQVMLLKCFTMTDLPYTMLHTETIYSTMLTIMLPMLCTRRLNIKVF